MAGGRAHLDGIGKKEEMMMVEIDPKDPKPQREAPEETPGEEDPIGIELPLESGDADGQPV